MPPNAIKPALSDNHYQTHWIWVLCLVGLDYFSTLGYQPSIAYQTAGRLAPLATLVVVAVTLMGAFPVYALVASRSPAGQGSMGMLERLVPGWKGKTLILILLGFAATDFIFTRTFSAADAAVHLLHNPNPAWQKTLETLWKARDEARPITTHPLWHKVLDLWDKQMVATVLLLLVGYFFWAFFRHGFTRRVIQIAVVVVAVYLFLNAVVIGSGLYYLFRHTCILANWYEALLQGEWDLANAPWTGTGGWALVAVCILLFPKMALGLSGFEMCMVAMPLIRGKEKDLPTEPTSRIRNARKLLLTAGVIMAVFLLSSALVTTTLIPAQAFGESQGASNRALAYLAHGELMTNGERADRLNPLFALPFGTVYDVSTIVILTLAGAAVTIGLRDLVPPYLQRLGMELQWAQAIGAILYVFNLVKLVVTVVFNADVGAQRGAYATSVLMLMASASVAAVIDRRRRAGVRIPWIYGGISAVFLLTVGTLIVTKPEGVLIGLCSVMAILVLSMISRVYRTTELRFQGFQFADDQTRFLWESLIYLEFPVLVPHHPGGRNLDSKENEIRARHRLAPEVPIVFVEAHLGDPSEFYQLPVLEVKQEEGRFTIRITRCTSIAHAITAAALELSKSSAPPEIHFGWSDERPFVANLNFILFGQGNIPWMVRELIRKAEPRPERQPRVFIG
ncbi:MAG TPA: amino acid transporter [Gemmataceae bacterium]|nr:amino acid transporter [Gemmataceae bacterium]